MTFDEYAVNVDDRWQEAFLKTWDTIETHLPPGFEISIFTECRDSKSLSNVILKAIT